MKNIRNICIIIGSGFSQRAGIPLSKKIDIFFLRDNIGKLLEYLSGEWRLIDFAEPPDVHNGHLGFDFLPYGFILNEWVNSYMQENKSFTNYENFYQFIIDNHRNELIVAPKYDKAYNSLEKANPTIKENPYYENYTNVLRNKNYEKIIDIINHLISDLLYIRIGEQKIKEEYTKFLKYIQEYEEICFITLNHDLLLEFQLQDILKLPFSDGYTDEMSELRSTKGKPLKIFKNTFIHAIKVLKLHGSIDTYKFIVMSQNQNLLQPTGDYKYFKTSNYDEKQQPQLYDLNTGKLLQDFHWNITPQFITGTNKEQLIKNDYMYRSLYQTASKESKNSPYLLIIGYGYKDAHINQLIIESIKKGRIINVININPDLHFPYDFDSISVINVPKITYLYTS